MNKLIKKLNAVGRKDLAFACKVLSAKDPTAERIRTIIKKILGYTPSRVKVKTKGNIVSYQCGNMVKEGPGQVVVKVVNRNGVFEYIVAVPNVASSDKEDVADDPFLKTGKEKDMERLFTFLEKTLNQAKNFLKARGVRLNKEGEIIE